MCTQNVIPSFIYEKNKWGYSRTWPNGFMFDVDSWHCYRKLLDQTKPHQHSRTRTKRVFCGCSVNWQKPCVDFALHGHLQHWSVQFTAKTLRNWSRPRAELNLQNTIWQSIFCILWHLPTTQRKFYVRSFAQVIFITPISDILSKETRAENSPNWKGSPHTNGTSDDKSMSQLIMFHQ